jgi:non-ribosomal peptide synthetase-like protein
VEAHRPASTLEYVGCGVLQVLAFLVYSSVVAVVGIWGLDWISEGSGVLDDYLRAVAFGSGTFVGACIVPILAKWVLVGRWRPQTIRIWSLAYFRFWLVKTLIRTNPLVVFFVGSPIFVLYLRALGAKIGRDVVIFAKIVPVCTDLLSIGNGTVIRKDVAIAGYRADGGVIRTGRVTLGRDVLVSEAAVLDIDTTMGDGSQLAHRSSLYPGQTVPAGERWHGSPAERTDTDFRTVDPAPCGTLRRVLYSIVQVLHLLFVNLPLAIGGLVLLLLAFPEIGAVLDPGPLALTSGAFYLTALEISAVVFFGTTLVGLLFVATVPRLLALFIKPDQVYPLYGFHFSVQRTIVRTTNSKFFTGLFGDSSYIVPYLRYLGYNLNKVVQTGSNFGTNVKHETPYLVSVGSGTMIADGLTIINTDFSNTSFRSSLVSIGPRNFLGNGIAYPAQGRTGDNCLLATKVMVPVDGPVREGVGLLGSPAFEIPRSVQRDGTFDHLKTEGELGRHLAAKNRYNLRTMGLVLLVRWLHLFAVTVLALMVGDLHHSLGAAAVVVGSLVLLVFNLVYGFLVERTVMGWQWLKPQFCSIYDPYFWWHERHWKTIMSPVIFNGTPMKGGLWRLLGVRIGKRVFDDGCDIPERSLVTIGDGATLNAGTWLQCHSQEDGAFKSDHITVGAGATVGVGAWVHYGATIGDGAYLATDSFLMKGEEVPAHAHWGGNPAQELRGAPALRPALADSAHPAVAALDSRPSGRHRAPKELDVAHRLPAAALRAPATAAAPRHR